MKTITVKFSNGELADLRIPDDGGESLCPVCGVVWLCGMAYYPAEPYATASDDICPGCKMQFGLDDGSEHTLEEVGQSFAVTRERIRQIEAKALRKLRHPSRSRKLRAFLEGPSRDYL